MAAPVRVTVGVGGLSRSVVKASAGHRRDGAIAREAMAVALTRVPPATGRPGSGGAREMVVSLASTAMAKLCAVSWHGPRIVAGV
jgi:hypothetical protein